MGVMESSHRKYVMFVGYLILVIATLMDGNIVCGGDLYKWVDENGVTHFSDQAPADENNRYKVTKESLGPPQGDGARMADLYTAETYRKLQKVADETPLPPPRPGMSAEERYRTAIEREREIFRKAGYDYDLVVRTIARDVRTGRIRLSTGTSNVAEAIQGSLVKTREYRLRTGVDCLRFFDAETAEAVKYLWEAKRDRELTILPPPVPQVARPAAQASMAPPMASGRSVPGNAAPKAPPRAQAISVREAVPRPPGPTAYDLKALLETQDFKGAERLLAGGLDPNGTVIAEDGCEPLLVGLCRAGKIEAVKFLVERGADIRRRTERRGMTPLTAAAAGGHGPIVRYLLSKGSDVNEADSGGATALAHAASGGSIDAVKILVGHGADVRRKPRDGKSPLFRAAAAGHASVVEYLLSKGADANDTGHYGETALGNAASRGWTEVVKILVAHGADVRRKGYNLRTPLANAAAEKHKPVVEYLLSKGADPNARDCNGDTALTLAMSRGWKEGVEMLARRGADVNAPAREGKTPLLLALERGRGDMADVLVALGARAPGPRLDDRVYDYIRTGKADVIARFLVNQCGGINTRAEFGSPLEIAAASGRDDLFDALVARGANVNARHRGGWTALMFAAAAGSREAVEFLLARGADATARNESGDTAVVLAAVAEKMDIVDILEMRARIGQGKQATPRPRSAARAAGNGIPAPFTVEAGRTIARSLDEVGKRMRGDAMKQRPQDPMPSPTAGAGRLFDMKRAAFAKAGYDFDATIRAVANDFRRNALPVNDFLESRSQETPFLLIVQALGMITIRARIDCSPFFDAETARAVEEIRAALLTLDERDGRTLPGSKESVEAAFRSVWKGMTDALKSNDIERALLYFCEPVRDRYRQLFTQMKKENRLDVYWNNVRGLELPQYVADMAYVHAAITRADGNGKIAYEIVFLRGDLGAWKVYELR